MTPPRRGRPSVLPALALALLVALAACGVPSTSASSAPCSTPEECCSLCGADSERCLRGPCSMNMLPRTFFSISMPTQDVSFWDVVFSFYGMVPYLVPIAIALELIFHRRSWTRVFAFLFIPIVAIINAVILVQSLGDCSECPRPCGSCVSSNGMPSGHATNAIGLCLWLILETLLGVGRHWALTTKAAASLGFMLLFVPVPYSRMYLGDHTVLQVGIGSADGVVLGLVYFFVLRYVVAKRLPGATEKLERGRFRFLGMRNDFYPAGSAASPLQAPLVTAEQQDSTASPRMRDDATFC